MRSLDQHIAQIMRKRALRKVEGEAAGEEVEDGEGTHGSSKSEEEKGGRRREWRYGKGGKKKGRGTCRWRIEWRESGNEKVRGMVW